VGGVGAVHALAEPPVAAADDAGRRRVEREEGVLAEGERVDDVGAAGARGGREGAVLDGGLVLLQPARDGGMMLELHLLVVREDEHAARVRLDVRRLRERVVPPELLVAPPLGLGARREGRARSVARSEGRPRNRRRIVRERWWRG
jgi:hypothetical protein